MNFYGREEILEKLRRKRNHRNGIAIFTGRRRIGKSYLAKFFAKEFKESYYFTGAFIDDKHLDRVNVEMLKSISEKTNELFSSDVKFINWTQFFLFLQRELSEKENPLIILDEISWLARGDEAGFKAALFEFCNFINDQENIFLIISGSASHWIKQNIQDDTNFKQRIPLKEVIPPLSIKESSGFWEKHSMIKSDQLKIISALGGVPRYLREIDTSFSYKVNLKNFFFVKGALGQEEFDEIFTQILGERESFKKVVIALSEKKQLSMPELKKESSYKGTNKSFKNVLEILLLNGFITECTPWSLSTYKPMVKRFYRLSDPYLRFYMKYVYEKDDKVLKDLYEIQNIESLENWDTIMGFQFENLILQNSKLIFEKLNLNKNSIIKNYGPYQRMADDETKGVQIDLLIDTEECYYICEIKMKDVIRNDVIDEVKNKRDKLINYVVKGKNIRKVLIYCGSLSNEKELKNNFDFVINAEDFL